MEKTEEFAEVSKNLARRENNFEPLK